MGVVQSLIPPLKGKEKRISYYNTGYSYLVTHPGAEHAEQGLALLSGDDVVLSLCCGIVTLNLENGSSVNSDKLMLLT